MHTYDDVRTINAFAHTISRAHLNPTKLHLSTVLIAFVIKLDRAYNI